MKFANEAVTPRNGHTVVVLIIARISGCAKQLELSLEDQSDHAKETAREMCNYPIEFREVSTTGKGEDLSRPELEEIKRLLRSREIDLVIVEDLGRLSRGTAAKDIAGLAVDHGTRVIALHDHIDTAEDTWEVDAISACKDHVGHNSHTSKRIKKRLDLRFQRSGGAVALPVAGIIVPDGSKSYFEWSPDPIAIPIIEDGFRRLKESLNGSAVAGFFNAVPYQGQIGFPPGKYMRSKTWDGTQVLRYYRNRILSGRPGRGHKRTVKRHGSGKRVSVKNPAGPKFIDCPNLRILDPDEQDELIHQLNIKNANYRRKLVNGSDPLLNKPRKRTSWPGGCATCWYCGRPYVWGGNGIAEHMMCAGAKITLAGMRLPSREHLPLV
jgi:hypothetical protein